MLGLDGAGKSSLLAAFRDGWIGRDWRGVDLLQHHVSFSLLSLSHLRSHTTLAEPLEDVSPTVGFVAGELPHGKSRLTTYDLGGGPRIRNIWGQYFAEVRPEDSVRRRGGD